MTKEEIDDLLMVGAFMGEKNLFIYQLKNEECIGVYIADDEDGSIDYVDVGIVWYSPHGDWNTLIRVCKKIINMYYDKREEIFTGLNNCDINATYKACVEFIKFWNDDSQVKMVLNKIL